MGILDDAIREHLELKRRHGADSAEVARQEREVLGGADVAGDDPPRDADIVLDADPYASDAGSDESYVADLGFQEPVDEHPPPAAPEPPSSVPAPADAAGRSAAEIFPGTGELLAAAAESAPAPAPATPPTPARPAAAPLAPAPAGADEETAARAGA
ncbi:MAG: hypothetical protein QM679_13055 [Patulibacter sp.]